jgi:hypothetical protein
MKNLILLISLLGVMNLSYGEILRFKCSQKGKEQYTDFYTIDLEKKLVTDGNGTFKVKITDETFEWTGVYNGNEYRDVINRYTGTIRVNNSPFFKQCSKLEQRKF